MNQPDRGLEFFLERLLTASRWLLAPFFLGLALGIVILLIKFVQEFYKLAKEAMALLAAHTWPGNIRELGNAIERAVVLCAGDQIAPEDLALPESAAPPRAVPLESSVAAGDFHAGVRNFKQAIIQAALRQAGDNQTKAAEVLGIQRTYLVKLLRSLKIRG